MSLLAFEFFSFITFTKEATWPVWKEKNPNLWIDFNDIFRNC